MKLLSLIFVLLVLALLSAGGILVVYRSSAQTTTEALVPVTRCQFSVDGVLLNAQRELTYACESVGQTTLGVSLFTSLPLGLTVSFLGNNGASTLLYNATSTGTIGIHLPSTGNGTFQVQVKLLRPGTYNVYGSVSAASQVPTGVVQFTPTRPYWRYGVGIILVAAATLVMLVAVGRGLVHPRGGRVHQVP